MSKVDLTIKGFKCFIDDTISLGRLTLLTGSNASGKSSVIQSLLLLKYASESEGEEVELRLDEPRYAFDFGNSDSLINCDSLTDEVSIRINTGGGIYFNGGEQRQNRQLYVHIDQLGLLKSYFSEGLLYLNAERQGPRYEHQKTMDGNAVFDCHGANIGYTIAENWNKKVQGSRLRRQTDDEAMFNVAMDDWVDYVFPGIAVRINMVGSQNYQILVRDKNHNVQTDSTNVGFGISYALPIVVAGLLAKERSWLVVENPEAHLHAKAQSNMGYFLGIMASSGLRVLVETHSEHIVNGIRRATVVSGRPSTNDINIYFFKGENKIVPIYVDSTGNLSDFPIDFFDQSRQDMLEIMKRV